SSTPIPTMPPQMAPRTAGIQKIKVLGDRDEYEGSCIDKPGFQPTRGMVRQDERPWPDAEASLRARTCRRRTTRTTPRRNRFQQPRAQAPLVDDTTGGVRIIDPPTSISNAGPLKRATDRKVAFEESPAPERRRRSSRARREDRWHAGPSRAQGARL